MRTMTIIILIFLVSQAQTSLGQNMAIYVKSIEDWKINRNTFPTAFGKLPSKQEGHLFGRYLITLAASTGVWTVSLATASLIDNGTTNAPREWFEDNALQIARPSVVLASSAISMLLYKCTKLKAFLTTTALGSALLLGSHFSGKLLSEEGDALLQLTTTFFLVPLTSTLYHHILSTKEENSFQVGRVKFGVPLLSIQQVNGEGVAVMRFQVQWF